MTFWEYETNKWLNTDYVARVEYNVEQRKVEQIPIENMTKGDQFGTVYRLKLTLLPGLQDGVPKLVEGLDRVREVLEILGIRHPILSPPDPNHSG
jgi:hypothetical protein